MPISPPSDIISDVARAADPVRLQAASRKLIEGASPAEDAGFDDAVKAIANKPLMLPGADTYSLRNAIRNDAEGVNAERERKAYQEFEAYILQTFVESMLPKEAENIYGKGSAGSIWKSMLAEQIGAQLSKAGGLGIAEKHLNPRRHGPSAATPQVPSQSMNPLLGKV